MIHKKEDAAMRTPLKKVKALGPAKSGTHHWIMQRVTAVALVLLSVWFITLLYRFFLCDTPLQMLRLLASPMNTVLFLVMMMIMLYHGMLGMQVVIEDYVHCRVARTVSIYGLYGITLVTAVAGFSAVIVTHVMLLG